MLDYLKKLENLRGKADHPPAFLKQLFKVKLWQRDRLARTYRDLDVDSRYHPAVQFFLEELYGTKDSALRDRDLIRIYPTMTHVLPKFAFETVQRAIELDLISEEFDQQLTQALGNDEVTESNYLRAFRAVGRRGDRLRQVGLLEDVCVGLDVVVHKPFIYRTLILLRGPSKLAGLSNMQHFLEAGFTSFRHMNGAEYFLRTIVERETLLINRILDNVPDPYAPITTWQPQPG